MIINFSILAVINLLVLLNLEKISKFIDLYDFPNKKLKKHKNKISLIGGTIIISNLFLFYVLSYFFDYEFFAFFQNAEQEIIFFIIIFLFYLLGFYDDKINLNPYIKLFISIIIITAYLYLDQNLIIQKFSVSFYQHKIFLESYSIFYLNY